MSDKQPNLSVRIVTYVLCAVVGAVLTMAANTYRIEHDPKSRFFIRIINRIREERAERQAEVREREALMVPFVCRAQSNSALTHRRFPL